MLRKILDIDVRLTEAFVKCIEYFMPIRQLKIHYKVLEISCHGMLWITSLLAFIWILNNKNLYQMQVNLMIAFILDIIIVAVTKAITRRRRPIVDNTSLGPDKYSFPSGHASRSMLIFYFFKNLWPVPSIFLLPLLAWVVSVVISRVLIRRHHLLDIVAGILLGYIEGIFMSIIYLDAESCRDIVLWISDEKRDGAEYDV